MCVHKYADLISSMTLHLMQNGDDGKDTRIRNGLSDMVDIHPTKLMTRKAWLYAIVWTLLLDGDGNQITLPKYTPDGYLDDLAPLDPGMVSLLPTNEGYEIRYNERVYRPDEVLHFAINPDVHQPWRGTGYRTVLREVVNCLRQAEATKQKIMRAPAPSVIVNVNGLMEEFQSYEGQKRLQRQYVDNSSVGEPWFIPGEAFKVESVKPLSLNDLAIKTSTELDRRAIAGIFGVPAFLVGVGEYKKDAYNNFITSCIMPMAQGIAQELTRKLLISPRMYWRFNMRSLYAYDVNEIISIGTALLDRMAMRRNEVRDWLGMSHDNEMDELLALENYIPSDKLGDQKKLIQKGEEGEADAST
jgi:HK97 family phage portal protein